MGYWIVEFIRVFVGYVFMMYLWPSVVFRKKLSGKSLTVRFAFCSTVSVLLVNTLILGLGLLHILKGWLVFVIFYGIFIASVVKEKELRMYVILQFRTFFTGTLGWKTLLLDVTRKIRNIFGTFFRKLNARIKGRRVEYAALSVLLVFAVAYFSYGAFQTHSYGWGDMYVHHSWIYGLKEGNIFSEGVYPEAMHCFIYGMNVLFGIPVYSCLMFLGEIHVIALLAAVYCLLREIMRSRYTVYFVLAAFLTVDVMCVDEIYGISRLQYTIPQEFGLYTQFLCALFLIRFLRKKPEVGMVKRRRFDWNLFLFMTSLAASIVIHFYVTIMAFFLCGSFAIFGISKVFSKRKFKPLLTAVILGVVISITPMALAFASGIPLQGSLNWGMNIINGTDTKEGRTQVAQEIVEINDVADQGTELSEEQIEELKEKQMQKTADSQGSQQDESVQAAKKRISVREILEKVKNDIKMVYQYGYKQLYGADRAVWLLRFTFVAVLFSIFNLIMGVARSRKVPFEMYAGLTLASVLFMTLYAAPFLGLPEIIAGARLCLTEQILLLAMMAIPLDEFLFLIGKTKAEGLMPYVSVLGILAVYAGTNYFGVFHGYLYYELTRYNSVVELTNEIIDKYPQYSYTIISTTEELYQAIESGRHEEILDFYNKSKQEDYYIPTEYLFFYIEKNPIQYAQYHFFKGPRWLAQSKYTKFYEYSNAVLSEGDEIEHSKISERLVGRSLESMGKASDAYSNIKNRAILESEMYYWCQDFKTRLPNEIKVYYEDDDFICYIVKQNPDHLYDLGE